MKVVLGLNSELTAHLRSVGQKSSTGDFSAIFGKALEAGGAGQSVQVTGSTAGAAGADSTKTTVASNKREQLLADLNDYLQKTPAEHMRDAIMAELGITEEDLKAMPPEKQAAVEAEISKRIQERMVGRDESPDAEADRQLSASTVIDTVAAAAATAAATATSGAAGAFVASLFAGKS
jgi:hypothetical protein